jgi:hypothetical protein
MCWSFILSIIGGQSTADLELRTQIIKAPDVNKIGWLYRRNAEELSGWQKYFCVLNKGRVIYFNVETNGHTDDGSIYYLFIYKWNN